MPCRPRSTYCRCMATPTDPRYTPPDFPVYESDVSRLAAVEREAGIRWLSGFNGRIGHPAQDVQLSWRTPEGAQTQVCTRRGHSGEEARSFRFNALFGLENSQFCDPGPPLRRLVTGWDHINELADDVTSWHPGQVVIDQEPVSATLTGIAGCQVGYVTVEDVVVYFVHRGLGDGPFALRRLPQPTDGYRIDPAVPQNVVELEREWDEFFRDRPDLDPDRSN